MSRIGMSTACYYPLETEKSLEKTGQLGFHTAEMFINSFGEIEKTYHSVYKEIQKKYEIDIVSLHTTASLADGYNFFSDYYRRYLEAVETFKKTVNLANELSSKFLVMHGLKKIAKFSDEEYCERFSSLIDIAKENGVTLLQENVVHFRSESPDYIDYMRKMIGESFAITLDIKQSYRAGFDAFDFVKLHSDIIKHVHISDHNTFADCIPPLEGDFDFKRLFRELNTAGYKGDYIIELYKHSYNDEQQIVRSAEKLNELLKGTD